MSVTLAPSNAGFQQAPGHDVDTTVTPLFAATRAGDVAAVERLLRHGADPNAAVASVKGGWTLVHIAAQGDHSEVINVLAKHKASIDRGNAHNVTPLHYSVIVNSLAAASTLLKHNADPNIGDVHGTTALISAAKLGDLAAAMLLIKYGAKVNAVSRPGYPDHQRSALFFAAMHGYTQLVDLLLDSGAEVALTDDAGNTALHLTVTFEIVEMLLAQRASLHARNSRGETPLQTAVKSGHWSAAHAMLKHQASLDEQDSSGTSAFTTMVQRNALKQAVIREMLAFVKTMLDTGRFDVNMGDAEERATALHHAAAYGHVAIAAMLLRHGADATAATDDGSTPLHWAAKYHQPEIMTMLVHHGCPLHACNHAGVTPLHVILQGAGFGAYMDRSTEQCEVFLNLMLAANVDVNMRDAKGCTLMQLATAKSLHNIAQLLASRRAHAGAAAIATVPHVHGSASRLANGSTNAADNNNNNNNNKNNNIMPFHTAAATPITTPQHAASTQPYSNLLARTRSEPAGMRSLEDPSTAMADLLSTVDNFTTMDVLASGDFLLSTSHSMQADTAHAMVRTHQRSSSAVQCGSNVVPNDGAAPAYRRSHSAKRCPPPEFYAEAVQRRLKAMTVRSFSSDELRIGTNNYSEANKIGAGGYGPVYKGVLRNRDCAIKLLGEKSQQGVDEYKQEVEILKNLRHPHIVKLYGVCDAHHALVFEVMSQGSLQSAIERRVLSWFDVIRIALESAVALAYIHNQKPCIVHRDIKPANILLDDRMHAKLADVGLARRMPLPASNKTHVTTAFVVGGIGYIDPHYQESGHFRPRSDLYSFGISLMQLVLNRTNVRGIRSDVQQAMDTKCLHVLLQQSSVQCPLQVATVLLQLALDCTTVDNPARRPDTNEVVRQLQFVFEDAAIECGNYAVLFKCPLSHTQIVDPVRADDGFIYERAAIEAWLKHGRRASPMTNVAMKSCLVPCTLLKKLMLQRTPAHHASAHTAAAAK